TFNAFACRMQVCSIVGCGRRACVAAAAINPPGEHQICDTRPGEAKGAGDAPPCVFAAMVGFLRVAEKTERPNSASFNTRQESPVSLTVTFRRVTIPGPGLLAERCRFTKRLKVRSRKAELSRNLTGRSAKVC